MRINKLVGNDKKAIRVIAPAKINLHLEILGLRTDGFHELAMLMQSISLCDYIDISKNNDGEIRLSCNNPNLVTSDENLIVRAAKLFKKRLEINNFGVDIYLTKNIPIGAGLAGGSSDAAATLLGLNILWGSLFSDKELEIISSQLGSDVPFCLSGGTQLCFGRGEVLEPLDCEKHSMAALLVKDSDVEVSTPWAYSKYKEINCEKYLKEEKDFEVRRQSLRNSPWLSSFNSLNPLPLRNDLQSVVAREVPAVKKSLEFLSSLEGAISVAMSGSGPSCFGLFADINSAKLSFEDNKMRLQKLGLDAWCCSLNSKGVQKDCD